MYILYVYIICLYYLSCSVMRLTSLKEKHERLRECIVWGHFTCSCCVTE